MKCLLIIILLYACGSVCCQSPQKPAPRPVIPTAGDSLYTYDDPSPDGTGKYFMGREIALVMGASGSSWLERPERQQEENTDLAIEKMMLSPDAVVADIGAGTGYYSFRMARKVPEGKVYAVELQEEMIRQLKKKKKESSATNVEVIRGDTINVNLPDNTIDLAILVDVYHELAYPREIIRSIGKSLKPAGKILLVEYRGEDPSIPIKALHKTTIAQLTRELNANGFVLDYTGEFLPIQHFLLFRKKD